MEIKFDVTLLHDLLRISNVDKVFIDSNGRMVVINDKLKYIRIEKVFSPKVIEEGYATITKDIINLLPKTGEVTLTDNTIKCNKRKIEYTSAECALKVPDSTNNTLIQLDKETMDFLLEVDYATAKDDTRPIIHGVHFKKWRSMCFRWI